ncbi:hypothetical protein F4808DRAFT_133599 [Astrocystis sublimbata]|nr:hypothetical protein F4808DRAFT_133599 [Astrocystis sublimbata]
MMAPSNVHFASCWFRKHVLRDLRPYICLAEDCNTASEEYSRRHEWMNHMSQKHWKSWTCPYQCGLKSTSETGFRQHITRVHGMKSEMELDAINARCGRHLPISPSSPVDCPLCPDTLESIQQYQRHVGRHQVDLALFALPKIEDDGEELDEPNEDQATISTQSGSGSEVMGAVSLIELAEPFDGGPTVEVSKGLPEMQPSQGNKAEGRDGEWFDRSNDVGIELKNEDSRGEPTPSQLAASLGEQELEHQHQEEAAWKKELEKEAKLKAEIEAQKKADHKEVAADATKTAENTKNKADEVFKQQALEKDDARPERSESLEKAKDTVNRYEEQEEAGEAEARRLLKIYKNREAENALKEREEAEERDRQYKQRLQEHLLKSGLDEKEINAIIAGMKIEKPKPEEKEKEHPPLPLQPLPQIGCEERPWPTHTRMARRHLSLETLRIYDVDYIIDQDPEYVLIKRWVPEPEQDIFWSHTRALRNGS